jgi:hypothetical protein
MWPLLTLTETSDNVSTADGHSCACKQASPTLPLHSGTFMYPADSDRPASVKDPSSLLALTGEFEEGGTLRDSPGLPPGGSLT